MEGEKEMF
jgi:serine/threonine protein kinase